LREREREENEDSYIKKERGNKIDRDKERKKD
jgi:hypothetical protein